VKDVLDGISETVKQLYHEVLDPVEERFAFEKRPSDGEIAGGPMVLVVGNHSSGKSTFLNYVLGEDVQRTGMAPTDDSFTILRFSEQREDRDGMAIVTNPDLPFGSLRQFGKDFLSHFRMRLLPLKLLKDVTLVDTPGMIDAADPDATRGYDFSQVVRWFAERADVVLVFFDPDRPGTTAESLTVLTQALSGMDHKLLVVLNKMDNFRSMRDFARCYGALCWNLGKVIKKKDIPQIYTTFVPVPGAPQSALPLDDFEIARQELISEIKRAPVRRVDNMITHAAHHAERLRMHARIVDRARARAARLRTQLNAGLALLLLIAILAAAYYIQAAEWLVAAAIGIGTVLIGYGLYVGIKSLVRRKEASVLDDLDSVFEEVYQRDLVVGNRPEDLLLLWDEVKPITRRTLKKLGLLASPTLRGKDLNRLNHCLKTEVPELRSRLHRTLEDRPPPRQPEKGLVS
jgi:GTP-binding protein EngB required for normal cell division